MLYTLMVVLSSTLAFTITALKRTILLIRRLHPSHYQTLLWRYKYLPSWFDIYCFVIDAFVAQHVRIKNDSFVFVNCNLDIPVTGHIQIW